MNKLEIVDLHVEVEGKEIVKGVSLTFVSGKVHALMGPNGSGKSTLAHALMGHPKYKVTSGKVILDGQDVTNMSPDQRAKLGLFLSFQYPAEVTGVTLSNFLRTAAENLHGKKYNVLEFHSKIKEEMKKLGMDTGFTRRYLNEGFSGGEKKKAEMLQLAMLKPKYVLLDETDSGMDVDSIKIVADGIVALRKEKEMCVIVITHYNRFLEYLQPDEVSIIHQGKIVASGSFELARKIEKEGFEGVINA
tara:strand:+ start:698 stop:1438 length:741 start_codon:yes stop_codon:yes gene_type:complete